MKIIQFFRGEQIASQYTESDSSLSYSKLITLPAITLGYLRARMYHDEIELFTDEAGEELIAEIPNIAYDKVYRLPSQGSFLRQPVLQKLDKFFISSRQDRPFLVMEDGVFMTHPLRTEIINQPVVIYAETGSRATNYFHKENIERLHTGHIRDKQCDGYDLALIGGTDFRFWKNYYSFLKEFIFTTPGLSALTDDTYNFLLSSYLLQNFAEDCAVTLHRVLTRPFRIPNLKSSKELFKILRNTTPIVIPDIIKDFQETYQFVMENLRAQHFEQFEALQKMARRKIREHISFPGYSHALFERTQAIFKIIHPHDQTPFERLFTKELEDKISTCISGLQDNHPFKQLLADAFHYELSHYNLHEMLKDSNDATIKQKPSYGQFKKMLDLPLTRSACTRVVRTAWDWKLGLRLPQLHSLKVIANSTVEPSHYNTLFVQEETTCQIQHYPIDDLTELVLSVFSSPKILSQGIDEVIRCFDDDDVAANIDSITETALLKIYDLFVLGALVIEYENVNNGYHGK